MGLVGTVAWICACVAVALAGVRGLAGWVFGEGAVPVAAAVAWAVVALELRWLLGRVGTWRWWTALVFPCRWSPSWPCSSDRWRSPSSAAR